MNHPLALMLDELKQLGEPVEVETVNECWGNSRGLLTPRVNGGAERPAADRAK